MNRTLQHINEIKSVIKKVRWHNICSGSQSGTDSEHPAPQREHPAPQCEHPSPQREHPSP